MTKRGQFKIRNYPKHTKGGVILALHNILKHQDDESYITVAIKVKMKQRKKTKHSGD